MIARSASAASCSISWASIHSWAVTRSAVVEVDAFPADRDSGAIGLGAGDRGLGEEHSAGVVGVLELLHLRLLLGGLFPRLRCGSGEFVPDERARVGVRASLPHGRVLARLAERLVSGVEFVGNIPRARCLTPAARRPSRRADSPQQVFLLRSNIREAERSVSGVEGGASPLAPGRGSTERIGRVVVRASSR